MGYSKMFEYLKSIEDTIARLACGQFTREGIAVKRNEQFIKLCEARGDHETAKLYREIIQPDEQYHHQLGRSMLQKYANDPDRQQIRVRLHALVLEQAVWHLAVLDGDLGGAFRKPFASGAGIVRRSRSSPDNMMRAACVRHLS